mmetsp:Transcript_85338/g.133330  ORF Transcript_85338/g.133330 Transcript_85338/m.133330 type:complete len:220 (+) Transcript_85338:75-734(+)
MATCRLIPMLYPVLLLQSLLCFCRWNSDDFLGAVTDAVVVIAGLVTVSEATSTPALLYGFLCFSIFFYDTKVSLQSLGFLWASARFHPYANLHNLSSILQSLLVSSAPIFSAAGAVIAGRIFLQSRANSHDELIPLLRSTKGYSRYSDKDGNCKGGAQDLLTGPESTSRQQLPLSGGACLPTGSPPFQAIFSTRLPKSPRTALAEKMPPLGLEDPGAFL